MGLENHKLQELYTSITKDAIEALRKIDADIQEIANAGMRKLEAMEYQEEMAGNAFIL